MSKLRCALCRRDCRAWKCKIISLLAWLPHKLTGHWMYKDCCGWDVHPTKVAIGTFFVRLHARDRWFPSANERANCNCQKESHDPQD